MKRDFSTDTSIPTAFPDGNWCPFAHTAGYLLVICPRGGCIDVMWVSGRKLNAKKRNPQGGKCSSGHRRVGTLILCRAGCSCSQLPAPCCVRGTAPACTPIQPWGVQGLLFSRGPLSPAQGCGCQGSPASLPGLSPAGPRQQVEQTWLLCSGCVLGTG